MAWLDCASLVGERVRLTPMTAMHANALLEAASDGELWNLWYTSVPSATTIEAYIEKALADRDLGIACPYVVIDKATNTVIGSTRYCRVKEVHRRLEIGFTWYAKRFQRTGVNTECKYLLLRHAFEILGCIAVEFRTDWFNLHSRAAISRLGAKQDGILRQHQLNHDGSYRDTVVFSITNGEWHGVKKSLEFKMKQYSEPKAKSDG